MSIGRILVTESCPHCKHPVFEDQGYHSVSGAHFDCHSKLSKKVVIKPSQKKRMSDAELALQNDEEVAGKAGVHYWLVTAPHPKLSDTGWDANQKGWRLHLVEGGKTELVVYGKYKAPALCGLVPRHGWGVDLFIDAPCKRCEAIAERLGIDIPDIVTA